MMSWKCRFCDKEIPAEEAEEFQHEFDATFDQFDKLFKKMARPPRPPLHKPHEPIPQYPRITWCRTCNQYLVRTFHQRQPELVASLAFVCGVVFMCALASIMGWWQ